MKIGFCGLGLMGSAMVFRLLRANHEVTVWNRSPGKSAPFAQMGARIAQTPREAAEGADAVLLCLFDAASVEAVVFGEAGVASARGLRWLADHSTISPERTKDLAIKLAQVCGADWIDAPVSGGIGGADNGTLTVMAGGESVAFDAACPAFRAYATHITHVGPAGAGQTAKLCNQTIVATTVAAIAEAVNLARCNGADLTKLGDALSGGWADSKLLQVFLPRILQAQPHSIGALDTMLKDIDSVMTSAQHGGAAMPVTSAVQQLLRMSSAAGLGKAELSAVIAGVWPQRRDDFVPQVG